MIKTTFIFIGLDDLISGRTADQIIQDLTEFKEAVMTKNLHNKFVVVGLYTPPKLSRNRYYPDNPEIKEIRLA